ncbi:hypothetical protein ACFQZO_23900 [Bradyrhizobium sp. GCM10027634]|uniref:hypothetical protein n=1 Tax=unclassified Bradyrhizobium TaxID=2631580 RepID=UPI00188AD16A|nr:MULTISPECIES: hypothetical protein [unclassified Bradyrhizobium]MDN5003884.1 hypothetical protein [Bradyrhizobium sp. WYCCWR 12677]QOZ45453.1 hypothetical protein XH89_19650 [Bradyrhizobium sp. CCBAU 53340]
MERFIARANIDHYLELLKDGDVPSPTRSTITTLLIEEEDKLGHDYEQLEFVESRAATCRARADRQRRLMDSFNPDSDDWVQAERVLVNFESLAQFVESYCHQMRRKVSNRPL